MPVACALPVCFPFDCERGIESTMFDPQSSQGLAISNLFIVLLIIGFGVFLLIVGLVTTAIVRYRHKPGTPDIDPSQDHGKPWYEIGWTIAPALLVLGIFVATVFAMQNADPKVEDRKADVTMIGHQWWWEVRYPNGIVTANEIHLRQGQRYLMELTSGDVQHAFWAPEIGRQMNMFPGQINRMYVEADRAGSYEGVCNQYCGAQHAWMRYRVVVQPADEFDKWVAQQLAIPPLANQVLNLTPTPSSNIGATPTGAATNPAKAGNSFTERPQRTGPTPIVSVAPAQAGVVTLGAPGEQVTGDTRKGAQLFQQLTCVSCHYIANSNTGAVAAPNVGPNLTHMGTRQVLAAGVLTNTPKNMVIWLKNPQEIKPGVHMPNFNLTDDEANDLSVYLESLR